MVEFFKIEFYFVLKAFVRKVIYKDKEILVCFFVRGDDNLEEIKVLNVLNIIGVNVLELREVNEEDLNYVGLIVGFIGFYGLKKYVCYIIFDEDLKEGDCLIVGVNEKDFYVVGVDLKGFENFVYVDIV